MIAAACHDNSWGLIGVCHAADVESALTRFESTQPQMGVPFKVILYAPDETTANRGFQAVFSRVAELNQVLSDYDPQSELSRLSGSAPSVAAVPVSDPLWVVLDRSQRLAKQTHGAFDVTVGPLVRLWRRARRDQQMPSPERLAEGRAAVGFEFLVLDEQRRTARLLKPRMRLDLGGIAMGYAVDESIEALRELGITRALVDASGDIRVGDPPPGTAGWTIDIIPQGTSGSPSRHVRLSHAAVTTAGDAFQHVVIDGTRYSHIVDPRTGLGLTDQIGVAVIARDCITADALDTAASVLGPQAGLQLIDDTPGAVGFIVRPTSNGLEIFESPGFASYVVPRPN